MWTWVAAVALLLSGCGMHGKPKIERKADPREGVGAVSAPARAPAPAPKPAGEAEPDAVVAPGVVEPWGGETELSAQEPGWIARIAVKEGEQVSAGQVVATLEDAAQRHAVELARADLAEGQAAFSRIEHGTTPEELRQAEAEHAAAAARGRLARTAAARSARLREQGVTAEAEADRAVAEAQAQTALAERAEARLAELRRGARDEDRSAARARVAAARARLELAEAGLARRQVVAPGPGTVLRSRLHVGEFYDPGAGPLLSIGDLTRLQVRLEVDEIDAMSVTRDAACVLYSDAGARLAEGTVVRIAPRMGRRGLPIESPTARTDVRVREVFVEIPATTRIVPGQRLWGHMSRAGTAHGPKDLPSREG
jgi:multidrug efflux pump subunit AcrA (membrane-fusion protein)